MDQEISVESGDKIKVLSGENKSETGKIIAEYNNSASIELDKKSASALDHRRRRTSSILRIVG
ncbi:hypothetical protein RZN25_15980 [Bacillaceae bacterium S4-13-56]